MFVCGLFMKIYLDVVVNEMNVNGSVILKTSLRR